MKIVIRPVSIKDAEDINEIRTMTGVRENTLALVSETVAKNEAFISNLSKDSHMLVAEVDGKVVGMAGLEHCSHPRKHHTGSIGISVRTDFQGRGIGTRLMEALIDLADNWLMITRLELTVLEGNAGAKRLYERLGFEQEGVKRMAVARGGRYADEIMMSRIHVPEQLRGY